MGDRRATVPPMQKTCNLRRQFFCAQFRTYFSKFQLCLVPQLFFSNSRHILLPTCKSFNPENPFWLSLEAVELACFEFSAFWLPYWPTCEISLNSHVTNAMLYTRVDIVNNNKWDLMMSGPASLAVISFKKNWHKELRLLVDLRIFSKFQGA